MSKRWHGCPGESNQARRRAHLAQPCRLPSEGEGLTVLLKTAHAFQLGRCSSQRKGKVAREGIRLGLWTRSIDKRTEASCGLSRHKTEIRLVPRHCSSTSRCEKANNPCLPLLTCTLQHCTLGSGSLPPRVRSLCAFLLDISIASTGALPVREHENKQSDACRSLRQDKGTMYRGLLQMVSLNEEANPTVPSYFLIKHPKSMERISQSFVLPQILRHDRVPTMARARPSIIAPRRVDSSWLATITCCASTSEPGTAEFRTCRRCRQASGCSLHRAVRAMLSESRVLGLQRYSPAENHSRACRYHPDLFSGGELAKYTGFVRQSDAPEHQLQAVMGSRGLVRFWDCCGETDPEHPGCTWGPHVAYGEE